MRPAETTTEEIIAAGQSLLKSGKTVTGFGLRQLLGCGNAQRLKAVWDEHGATGGEQAAAPAPLPAELAELVEAGSKKLAEQFMGLAASIHAKASQEADKRVAELVAAAHEKAAQADQELSAANVLADEQDRANEALGEEIASLKGQIEELQEQARQDALFRATVSEREAQQNALIQRLTSDAQEAQRRMEALQAEKAEAQAAVAVAVAEVAQVERQLTQEKENREAIKATTKQMLDNQTAEIAELKKSLKESTKAAEDAAEKLAAAKAESAVLTETNKQLIAAIESKTAPNKETGKETKETAKNTNTVPKKTPVKTQR